MSLKRMPSSDFETFDDLYPQREDLYSQREAYSDVDEDSLGPYDPVKTTPVYHIHQAEEAMNTMKNVCRDPNWKKVHTHRTVTVWTKSGVTKDDKIPLFKGEGIIQGFSPQSIFAVISMRALWDEWYEEGNLIENLNETTSLTYMVMRGTSGAKIRDLSLVEKIECTPTGTIYFVSTSVDTPKVPRVADKVRAKLKLNGWILEPLTRNPPSSRVTYILQTSVGGWFPALLVNKYMSKRPLVIYSIDQYLQKNGPPPMVVNAGAQTPPRKRPKSPSRADSVTLPSTNGYQLEREVRRNVSRSDHDVIVRGIENMPTAQMEHSYRAPPTPPIIEPHYLSERMSGTRDRRDVSSVGSSIYDAGVVEQPQNASSLRKVPSALSSSSGHSRYSVSQYPHGEVVKKTLGIMKNFCSSLEGWQLYTENKGIKIYTKESPGKSMPFIRGEGTITGGWTAEDINAVIVCLDMRKLWDDRYDDGEVVKYYGNDDALLRTAMKGTFPISGRDVVCAMTTERHDDTGVIWTVSTSVVDAAVPESRKYVRANLGVAGWLFRPHINESGFTTAVDVSYIVDIDIRLDSIPSSILKTLSMGTPMCIAKVDDVLHKYGPPPYVLRTTAMHGQSRIDIKTNQYQLTLTKAAGSVTELKISRKMYPEGFDISIDTDDIRAELLPKNSEVVRITVLLSGPESINLRITKQTSRSNQITLNGRNNIPIATPLPAVATTQKTNGVVNGVQQQTSLSRSVQVNGLPAIQRTATKRNRKPPQGRTIASIPQTINTIPQTFYKTEVQASATVVQQLPVVENRVQQEPMQNVKASIQNETTIPAAAAAVPVTPSAQPIGRDVIIISDALRFNTHQLALVFSAMLIAYYAGKMSGCLMS